MKLSNVSHPRDWFPDFTKAVRPIHANCTDTYYQLNKEKIEAGTLRYRDVAKDFRDSMERIHGAPNSGVAKGSFGPTFLNEEAETAEVEVKPDAVAKATIKRGKRKHGRGSIGRSTDLKKTFNSFCQPCKACSQRHDWRTCYYLFPNLAPEGFQEKAMVRKYVDLVLQTDKDLAKWVEEEKKASSAD